MNVQATLVIAGDVTQALRAVAAHDISMVKSATEQTNDGVKVTKVIIDNATYGKEIESWFNERQAPDDQVPGSLVAATWV